MASSWPIPTYPPRLTALLHLSRECGFATYQTNDAEKYGDAFEKVEPRGGTTKNNWVHTQQMIAQAAIQ